MHTRSNLLIIIKRSLFAFLIPYKHPTNVVIHLIKIIILCTNNVLPVNVGYNVNGNSAACMRCSNCYVCSMICPAPLYLQHVTFAKPVAIHLRYRIISISYLESVYHVLLSSSSSSSSYSSSSLSTVSAPEWETYQT